MDKIADLADKAKRQLASTTNKSGITSTALSPTNTAKGQSDAWVGLGRAYIAGIFKKFGDLYGNVWNSQISSADAAEAKMRSWAKVLSGVEPIEIGKAFDRLPAMPPSAPQFRALCKQDAPACVAHKQFQKELPKPPPDIEKGRAAIAAIRDMLRNKKKDEPEPVAPPERAAADEFAFGRGAEYEARKEKGFIQ